MNVGLHKGIPAKQYFALPAVSVSSLKNLKRSPLHYQWFKANTFETSAMALGTAAHTAILEPERFNAEFKVWAQRTESGRMAPRTGKNWEAFVAKHPAATIITADEFELVAGMRAAVWNTPAAMRYLYAGDAEVTMRWDAHGHQCKGRADWLASLDGPVIFGLKTAKDCRHFVFGAAAAKLGYHMQWAYYHDGYEAITGECPAMVEVVVESAPPHAVAVYRIPNDILEQGRAEYIELLAQLARCQESDEWPGPCVDEQELTLPSWVYDRQDDISELGLEV